MSVQEAHYRMAHKLLVTERAGNQGQDGVERLIEIKLLRVMKIRGAALEDQSEHGIVGYARNIVFFGHDDQLYSIAWFVFQDYPGSFAY